MISTGTLNDKVGDQGRISLKPLLGIGAEEVSFDGLPAACRRAAEQQE